MKIIRSESPTSKASTEWFTGYVYVDPVAVEGSGICGGVVHFTSGARTA